MVVVIATLISSVNGGITVEELVLKSGTSVSFSTNLTSSELESVDFVDSSSVSKETGSLGLDSLSEIFAIVLCGDLCSFVKPFLSVAWSILGLENCIPSGFLVDSTVLSELGLDLSFSDL
uniref:Uncharacterized protein n=1 Tax=Cacopsylla melanoneura TaxID=428564 RepID=A0A8D8XVV6_9HEMI